MDDTDNFDDDSESDAKEPLHAAFQHNPVSAIVPESIGAGVFANGAIVLSGTFEFTIDFVVRMLKPNQIVARVILTYPVAEQFIRALSANVDNYEKVFGSIPGLPQPQIESPLDAQQELKGESPPTPTTPNGGTADIGLASANADHVTDLPQPAMPSIEDIYGELKLPELMMGGKYANAVLLRHTATEFCFDFIANYYPKSVVTSRVIIPTVQVPPLLNSLKHSFEQRRRQQ